MYNTRSFLVLQKLHSPSSLLRRNLQVLHASVIHETIRFIPICQQDLKSSISIQIAHHHSIFDPRHPPCSDLGVMAATIESSGEPSSSMRNPPDEEWITRITQL
jgi:hypothetical protein